MKRHLLTILFVALFVFACQSQPDPAPAAQAPAQPASVASQPSTATDHLAKAKEHLHEAKEMMEKQGTYECCVEPDCDWCALKEGSCPCEKLLKGRKPVCPDCKFGWENGKGHVAGFKASQVKTAITHSHGPSGHEHK